MQNIARNIRLLRLLLPIACIFAFLLCNSSPAWVQAAAPEIDLGQYITQLRTASEVLDGSNLNASREFRISLPPEWVVRTGGQTIRIQTDWLKAALETKEHAPTAGTTRPREARAHLAALLESAEALAQQTDGADLAQSHARIDRILQDREYHGARGPSWLDMLKARIYAWLSRQFDKFFGRVGIPAAAGNILAWTLIAITFLLLAVWSVRALLAAASRSEIDFSGAARAGQDWHFWAREARAASERSDYRGAIHAAYWAAVARLEERRLLPEDRSRTPRESLRLVQRSSAAYTPLEQLTRRFELTWYGYRTATSADWNDAMQQLETLGCLPSSTPVTGDL